MVVTGWSYPDAMQGRVYRRDGKKWAYTVDVGVDPMSGRRRQKTKGGFATRKEAEGALHETIASVHAGTYVPNSKATVGEYLEGWLGSVKSSLRPTTWISYSLAVQRLSREIGAVKLQALAPLQVEAAYAALIDHGGKHGKPLEPKTVRNCHVVLHRALSDAERLGMVPRNAAHAAKAPSIARKDMMTWTAEDVGRFLEHVSKDRLYAAYVLLATTGMRRGEVMGLRWSEVDLKIGRLSVTQSITTMHDRVFVGPTKTPKSRRNVMLDEHTVAVLRAHRKHQLEEQMAIGRRKAPDALVFCDVNGSPLHPDRFTDAFQRHVRDSGLPALRGPHSLRHTWATLALTAGVHPKVVSDRLGHSTIAITLDIYSHVSPALDAAAAETVARQIFALTASMV